MSTIMQQQYFSLRNQNQDFDIRLAKLWAEAKDIYAQLSPHELRRNELQNRLYDSNQSLTGPAVSEIASGPNNGSLRRIVVLMILERSKVEMNLEKEVSIVCNFIRKYKIVLKDHEILCREADIIDQQLTHIKNEIGFETMIIWNDIYTANSN